MPQTFDILVDYDDVLYPWSARAHQLCSQAGITGGNIIDRWYFWESYGVPEEVVQDVLDKATLNGQLYDAPMIPDTLAQLRRLRYAGHRVHIVTARGTHGEYPDLVELFTRNQVSQQSVPFDTLSFTRDKATAAAELGCTFALDDAEHNYVDLTDSGVTTGLMDAVHNQEFDVPAGLRMYSVRQFVDSVLFASHWPAGFANFEPQHVASLLRAVA